MPTSVTIWDAEAARARCKRSVEACERFFAERKRPESANGQAFFDLCLAEFEVRKHLLAADCFSSREALIAELRRLLAEPVIPSSMPPCHADQYLACQKQDIEVEIHNLTRMDNPEPKKKPLQQLELICIMVAAMPGILMLTGGRVQNREQAVFRISVFFIGLLGFVAVKIYQHRKMRGE